MPVKVAFGFEKMPIKTRNDRATMKPQASIPVFETKASMRSRGAARLSVFAGLVMFAGMTGASPKDKKQEAPSADPFEEALTAAPFAILELSRSTVSLPFPSGGEPALPVTIEFVVTGNARATLTAEPAEVVTIEGREHGRAENGAEAIGFDVILEFEDGKQKKQHKHDHKNAHKHKGKHTGSTSPGSSVMTDLIDAGMERAGTIQVITDTKWALNGGIPLPGNYVGEIIVTLTAEP